MKIDKGIPAEAFTRVVREDDVRRDLLFAGTERGLFISWNGGRDWQPVQLNLPMAPITDLRVHQGDLIAATSGRSFWILDDLELVRQHRSDAPTFHVYKPADAYLVNGGSELNAPDEDFKGSNPFRGVNPANGVVLYYQLPELAKTDDITLEIADASGRIVRTLSSKKDTAFKRWDGGPPAAATLPKSKGLNRFVWDMRHNTMTGVPGVYIEANYRGHKASPGRYRFTIKQGDKSVTTDAAILANPLYTLDAATYTEYDTFMSGLEREVTTMHETINRLNDANTQLKAIRASLPDDAKHAEVRRDSDSLMAKLKGWDGDMVSRRRRMTSSDEVATEHGLEAGCRDGLVLRQLADHVQARPGQGRDVVVVAPAERRDGRHEAGDGERPGGRAARGAWCSGVRGRAAHGPSDAGAVQECLTR